MCLYAHMDTGTYVHVYIQVHAPIMGHEEWRSFEALIFVYILIHTYVRIINIHIGCIILCIVHVLYKNDFMYMYMCYLYFSVKQFSYEECFSQD